MNCHNFTWYLKNIYSEKYIVNGESLFFGQVCTELLKGHLKNKNISSLWPQIAICSNIFKSVPTYSNLWPQISLNLWPQVQICSHRFESVATDSKYFYFSDVPLKAGVTYNYLNIKLAKNATYVDKSSWGCLIRTIAQAVVVHVNSRAKQRRKHRPFYSILYGGYVICV